MTASTPDTFPTPPNATESLERLPGSSILWRSLQVRAMTSLPVSLTGGLGAVRHLAGYISYHVGRRSPR